LPKLSFAASPQAYIASSGAWVDAQGVDLVARVISTGKLHHATTGTGAIAAANILGSIVHSVAVPGSSCIGPARNVRFGHPPGVLEVGVSVAEVDGEWIVKKVAMSRSARRLLEVVVLVPACDWEDTHG
jgi:2-methylaconitate cis-trans-isomerase PrpF